MSNVIEKLRELEAKVDAKSWPLVGDENWREIDDILDAYKPEGYTIEEVFVGHGEGGRWTTTVEIAYKITQDDGNVAHFRLYREEPATEMQEGGNFTFGFCEVVPRPVTVVQYFAGRAA